MIKIELTIEEQSRHVVILTAAIPVKKQDKPPTDEEVACQQVLLPILNAVKRGIVSFGTGRKPQIDRSKIDAALDEVFPDNK